jgi:tetratricopeptide (TPR) repeat protein
MIKTVKIPLLFCLFATSVFSQSEDETFAHADSLLKAREFAESIPYYDKLIAQNSSNEMYYRGRGYAYIGMTELDKGESDYRKALELNPNCSNCYNNLGKIEANRGNLNKAIQLLNTAIEKDENNGNAYFFRARIKEFNNDKTSALFDYNKAIKLNPDEAQYYAYRGTYNMNAGYSSLAKGDFDKAYLLDSNNIEVVYPRSQYFINIQDWDKALIDLNRCVELKPADYKYYGAKGTVLEFLERHDEAIENYNLSLQIDSTRHLTYMNRAIARYSIEDMDGTCADNNKALELIEKTEENESAIDYLKGELEALCNLSKKSYYYQRGIAAYNLNQFEQAKTHYDKGLIQFPKSPMLLSFRGNALKAMGNDSEAIADYIKFLQFKGDVIPEIMENPKFQNMGQLLDVYESGSVAAVYGSLAESYANTGSYEVAISYADSAIDLLLEYKERPEYKVVLSSYYTTRGVIHNVQGDYEKAKSDFSNAIAYDKTNPLPHVNMAFALINKKKALQYNTINMGFYVNSKYVGNKRTTLPVFNKKKINDDNLLEALTECNTAIELDKKNAFAYLVRAQIKILMDQVGYCIDALTAKELGILDAEDQLGIKCN